MSSRRARSTLGSAPTSRRSAPAPRRRWASVCRAYPSSSQPISSPSSRIMSSPPFSSRSFQPTSSCRLSAATTSKSTRVSSPTTRPPRPPSPQRRSPRSSSCRRLVPTPVWKPSSPRPSTCPRRPVSKRRRPSASSRVSCTSSPTPPTVLRFGKEARALPTLRQASPPTDPSVPPLPSSSFSSSVSHLTKSRTRPGF